MSENESAISHARSYSDMGEFWDTHDLTEFWDQTHPAEFEIGPLSRTTYFALDRELSQQVISMALDRGVSPETMLNLLVQERLQELSTGG